MKQHLSFSQHNISGTYHIPERIKTYTEELKGIAAQKGTEYFTHEHSLRLVNDTAILAEVTHMVERYWNTQLRYVIVVGIGGSNLGAQAVYDAVRGERDGLHDGAPQIIFADTISSRLLSDIERLLELEVAYPEEIVINLISKSGGTTESIANFEILYGYLLQRFPQTISRIVVTTDHNSPLWKEASKHQIGLLPIPKQVGGRFSVFSTVGLFPLALVGINVQQLIEGGRDVLKETLSGENSALRLAETIFNAHNSGASIINFFFFNPELESLGKWARQLYAESLGKEHDRSGKLIRAGITPIVSIGSTDLHSMAQLYLGGPKDKFTLFIHISGNTTLKVPTSNGLFTKLVPSIAGKSPDMIMSAIYDGVVAAYDSHKLPYGKVVLPGVSLYALGMFLEWQMLTIMYLGELMHVNTFDQPNVEDYKNVTKDILASL